MPNPPEKFTSDSNNCLLETFKKAKGKLGHTTLVLYAAPECTDVAGGRPAPRTPRNDTMTGTHGRSHKRERATWLPPWVCGTQCLAVAVKNGPYDASRFGQMTSHNDTMTDAISSVTYGRSAVSTQGQSSVSCIYRTDWLAWRLFVCGTQCLAHVALTFVGALVGLRVGKGVGDTQSQGLDHDSQLEALEAISEAMQSVPALATQHLYWGRGGEGVKRGVSCGWWCRQSRSSVVKYGEST
jgi:hypothetical protein